MVTIYYLFMFFLFFTGAYYRTVICFFFFFLVNKMRKPVLKIYLGYNIEHFKISKIMQSTVENQNLFLLSFSQNNRKTL